MKENHRDILKVVTLEDDKEATHFLRGGWVLLSTGVRHVDTAGCQAKTYFTLGLKGENNG